MKKPKPLGFTSGWLFQDSGQELEAFQQHYNVVLPGEFTERVWPYAEGLLSTNRKAGLADGRSVWWMTLLKLRTPKTSDWEAYHLSVEQQKVAPFPRLISHDLISVYLSELKSKFYRKDGTLRFFPFGSGHRFMPKPETLEEGFLCFAVDEKYSVWYLPAGKMEEYELASSFEEMMAFPQRRKK